MTENTAKPDRRKERTRQLMRDALMELIVEKGYEAISIQDITERANVAHPTFYLHFKDKDELLFNSLREVYDGLVQQHEEELEEGLFGNTNSGASDFRHVQEHAEFYRAMLSKKGSIAFLIRVLEYLQDVMEAGLYEKAQDAEKTSPFPPGLLGSFLAGAHIGVWNWWLKQSTAYTPEEMADMVHEMCIFGMSGVLGANDKEIAPQVKSAE